MIGDVLHLMLQSEMHRDWYVHDLERLVIPAIENDRMLVKYVDSRPTGLFSYAFLPKFAEDAYKDGSAKLTADIWKNEPDDGMLWVIDFIAPYNNALSIGRFVQRTLTDRYLETYPMDGAHFIRQAFGKKVGYATGVQADLDVRRYSCAV